MKEVLITVGCVGLTMTGSAVAQKPNDAAKGQKIFARCVVCHDAQSMLTDPTDHGPDELAGPGLKGLFRREKLRNGKKVTEENVLALLKDGGSGMPAFREILTDDERANLVAY